VVPDKGAVKRARARARVCVQVVETGPYRLVVVHCTDELLIGYLSTALLVDGIKHDVKFTLACRQICTSGQFPVTAYIRLICATKY